MKFRFHQYYLINVILVIEQGKFLLEMGVAHDVSHASIDTATGFSKYTCRKYIWSSNFIKLGSVYFQNCNISFSPSTGLIYGYNTQFKGKVLVLAYSLDCFKTIELEKLSTISTAILDTERSCLQGRVGLFTTQLRLYDKNHSAVINAPLYNPHHMTSR